MRACFKGICELERQHGSITMALLSKGFAAFKDRFRGTLSADALMTSGLTTLPRTDFIISMRGKRLYSFQQGMETLTLALESRLRQCDPAAYASSKREEDGLVSLRTQSAVTSLSLDTQR